MEVIESKHDVTVVLDEDESYTMKKKGGADSMRTTGLSGAIAHSELDSDQVWQILREKIVNSTLRMFIRVDKAGWCVEDVEFEQ